MGLLFAIALMRAEARWAACGAEGRICFNYPMYLKYGTWQAIDLNWPGLVPLAALDLLPGSMSDQRSLNGLRIAVAVLCVAIFWKLLALWYERLQAGRRLAPGRHGTRIALGLATGLLTPVLLVAIGGGLIRGWHGPTNTIAAFVGPLAICILSLIELGLPSIQLMRYRSAPAVGGSLLVLPYVWADAIYQESCAGTVPPAILDVLSVYHPVGLLASELVPYGALRALIVGLYGASVMALASQHWPHGARNFEPLRPWIRRAYLVFLTLAGFMWILAWEQHGPTGVFGGFAGTAIVLYALSANQTRTSAASTPTVHDPTSGTARTSACSSGAPHAGSPAARPDRPADDTHPA